MELVNADDRLEVIMADLAVPEMAAAIVDLLEQYARDPMGGGDGLTERVKENLIVELAKRPNIRVLLAYVNDTPAGLLVCMEGFSTFACRPLLNIHDIIVSKNYRRRGLAQLLLQKAENIAKELGCCKLTLEVLSGNEAARSTYHKFGFSGYQLDPANGEALFWQKPL
jgi:ribosomal protein S18 acetylase RimI-like enzyme